MDGILTEVIGGLIVVILSAAGGFFLRQRYFDSSVLPRRKRKRDSETYKQTLLKKGHIAKNVWDSAPHQAQNGVQFENASHKWGFSGEYIALTPHRPIIKPLFSVVS